MLLNNPATRSNHLVITYCVGTESGEVSCLARLSPVSTLSTTPGSWYTYVDITNPLLLQLPLENISSHQIFGHYHSIFTAFKPSPPANFFFAETKMQHLPADQLSCTIRSANSRRRRAHTKSRRGCVNCKTRRVKVRGGGEGALVRLNAVSC